MLKSGEPSKQVKKEIQLNQQGESKSQPEQHVVSGYALGRQSCVLVVEICFASSFIATSTGNALGLHLHIAPGTGPVKLSVLLCPDLYCDSCEAQSE